MALRLLTLAVVVGALTLAGPAWAHVPPPDPSVLGAVGTATVSPALPTAPVRPEVLTPDVSPSPLPWLLAMSAALGVVSTLRNRRLLALALLVLVFFGAFETGVHSAHHLSGADAAKCVVASVASQIGGTTVDPVAVERPADVVVFAVPSEPVPVALSRSLTPDLGRAPPAA